MEEELKIVECVKFYRALVEKVNNVCDISTRTLQPTAGKYLNKRQVFSNKLKPCSSVRKLKSTKVQNNGVRNEKYKTENTECVKCKQKNIESDERLYDTVENYLKSTIFNQFRKLRKSARITRNKRTNFEISFRKIGEGTDNRNEIKFEPTTSLTKTRGGNAKNSLASEMKNGNISQPKVEDNLEISQRLQPNCEISISELEEGEAITDSASKEQKELRPSTQDKTLRTCRTRRRMMRPLCAHCQDVLTEVSFFNGTQQLCSECADKHFERVSRAKLKNRPMSYREFKNVGGNTVYAMAGKR